MLYTEERLVIAVASAVIEDLRNEVDILIKVIKNGDKMLRATTIMKVDGWLDEKYDLPDQRDLVNAALKYLEVRYSDDVKAIMEDRNKDKTK